MRDPVFNTIPKIMKTQTEKQIIGNRGEDIACEYLTKNGYRIVGRNFRVQGGELDIIARHNDELIFFEVKTRGPRAFGYPEEAVTIHKMKRITRAIKYYLCKTPIKNTYIRFDIISVELQNNLPDYKVNHLKNIELKENFV